MDEAYVYTFNQFELLPDRHEIRDGGVPQRLGSRAFELLVVLVERRARTVGKHELMDLVWPKLVVEENNLQVQVSALRKLLGHGAIATVPGRGYRFVLPVQLAGAGSLPPAAAGAAGFAAANLQGNGTRSTGRQTLIGRASEQAAVTALLDLHPVVTIAGTGGIGKTRLAQAVAAARRLQHADGVWWVDLSAINDPALVSSALARAMGLPLHSAQDPGSAAMEALRGRAALVVLDNAEHLLDAVADLVAAIRAAAGDVRVLVTSQEVMRQFEEQVFRLGPLALPSAHAASAEHVDGALALFAARARAADPHFVLGPANRDAAVEICRRLDGMPLAIELAAARVPLLGVGGVRDRLAERLRLLTGGTRTGLRRHQTLRAALDWSHALLSEPERRVLRRLSVFGGSFLPQAAQAVASDAQLDDWDVIDHLAALADRSLVVAESGAVPRLRLLETTRFYAIERLAQAGETDACLRAHAEHYATLAERADAEMAASGTGADVLARLDDERDEILRALDWCASSADRAATDIGLQLVARLRYYWPACGLIRLGYDRSRSMLAKPWAGSAPDIRSDALAAATSLAAILGKGEDVSALARQNLQLCRSTSQEVGLRTALLQLAWQHIEEGQPELAEPLLQDVLSRARSAGHGRHEGHALNGLARLAADRGQPQEARQLLETLVVARRKAGQNHDLCIALLNASDAACGVGDGDGARSLLLEAVRCARRTGSAHLTTVVCNVAPTVLGLLGQHATVVALHAFAQSEQDRLALPSQSEDEPSGQALLASARFALTVDACANAQAEGGACSPSEVLDLIEDALSRSEAVES